MEQIKFFLERVIGLTGLSSDYVPMVRYAILVIAAFLLAWLTGWLCRKFVVPVVQKITGKTDATWDDVIFSRKVLNSASRILPLPISCPSRLPPALATPKQSTVPKL